MSEIELPEDASMKTYQRYVHDLESMHGWLDVDLVHNCFLMGEEVGELHFQYYPEAEGHPTKTVDPLDV